MAKKQPASHSADYLLALRHTSEHVLHQAVKELYPDIHLAMGPATDEGFYFDFDSSPEGKPKVEISSSDFAKIEQRMQELIDLDLPVTRHEVSESKARQLFADNPYKQEWIDSIVAKGEKISIYWTGKEGEKHAMADLCSGPHVSSTGEIKAFKLLSVAGAYWHGSEKNKMLTRIYGVSFPSKQELADYLELMEQAKLRDHRKLGQELELFMIDDEVGQGLIMWLPKGAFIRHKVMDFAFNTYLSRGYVPVVTPHIASSNLWQHSGHLDFYAESMYNPFGIEDEEYRLKPMNCPFHVKMYQHRPRSYKELPMRWTEMGTVYRYEKSGTLHGLTRVRGFTQDDAHIICTPDQLQAELTEALKLTMFILNTFGFEDLEMNLSTRGSADKSKFIGEDKNWQMAEKALKRAMADLGYDDYVVDEGGAAFYGPKIDVKVADSLGRMWQLSTIQLDFNLPGRFKMRYVGADGAEHEPFMIHRALLGSLERFMGVYIEHTAGKFPVWLSPVQIKLLPITDKQTAYAKQVMAKLQEAGLRVELDDRSERLQAKIRDSELEKVPYVLVLGAKEAEADLVNLRERDASKDQKVMSVEELIALVQSKVEKKE